MTTTILQPPPLKIDELLCAGGRKLTPNNRLERRIVWNLLAHLSAKGFRPVSVGNGDDDTSAPTPEEVMELVFDLDEATVFLFSGTCDYRWFKLVMGNGVDMVSDWGIPHTPDGFDAAMTSFDPDLYA